MASIPACHAGDRGSIPRDGVILRLSQQWTYLPTSFDINFSFTYRTYVRMYVKYLIQQIRWQHIQSMYLQ